MSYIEPQQTRELPVEVFNFLMDLYNKQTRSPRLREVQKREDRENCIHILKVIAREGFMTKDDILKITGWTYSQYSTRMTKLIKDHPGQIKYNKNLKRIDKVNSKKQVKLK